MSVIVSVEEKGPSQKQVKVAIPAPAVEAESQRVAQEYRKKVRIPGFRKGKVPSELLKRRFGEDIEREVVERLVPRYWRQAEAEAQLQPMLPPELGDVDHRPGEDLTFVAIVDLAPEIELRNITDFDLPDPAVEPSEKDLSEALEELRRSLSDWVATERPAAQGDRVEAKIREGVEGGDEGEENEGQPLTFEIGDSQVWEELGLAATGKTGGQTAEFTRAGAEGEPAKSYQVEIEQVLERDPPPLDDAFAERVGKFESLEELRQDIGQRLTARNEQERRKERESALLAQLIERHPMQLSDRVIHHEVEQLLGEYAGDLARQGVDVENAGLDWQKLGEQVRPQAEHRVKSRLILDEIADREQIAVSDQDLEVTIAALARREGQSSQMVRQALDRGGRLAPLKRQLRRDKTIRRLLGEERPREDGEVAGDESE